MLDSGPSAFSFFLGSSFSPSISFEKNRKTSANTIIAGTSVMGTPWYKAQQSDLEHPESPKCAPLIPITLRKLDYGQDHHQDVNYVRLPMMMA
ncbi:MAG: hypothetical protein AAGA46_00980 [Cyanobacteria bacterium P01_F01_bin.13]